MAHNESFTTEEIAQLLKVSKLTVYDLIKKGELKAFRVGRQMRVDVKELENYKTRGQEVKSVQGVKTGSSGKEAIHQVVISGQDVSLDILARQIEAKTNEIRPLRSYAGSLDSLIAMYLGKADIVSTHLLDGDTLEYNLPYIRKMLVSQSFVVIHMLEREAGLYVAKGNPHDLQAWKDFAKPGIKLINRETGAGARVLLDEQLRLNSISRNQVNGYDNIQTSHLGVASAVANGRADVGIGIEQPAKVANIDFIPLITESYDLVILKNEANKHLIDNVTEILNNKEFKEELQSLGYGVERTGKVVYEQ
ncbi:helix-turn-helix domain-containing protein [Siminovitchia acidinfaciens]|uniref:Helix-turn-helix domain-containing protein n=1 Tax=Siminovitchia acidinfaciens TaxID=2321395 RepID=A0A429XWG0_9BACI|nr:helix-turn-helix transcriptional regulator [Siminovitchia acidinfaciens]RST72720.1 helix-turn-helix domain-containing protein [Siminovitchia acidinfaciens]